MPRDRFIDPASVLADYTWDIGHAEEEEQGRDQNVEETASTAGTGLVKQQGEPTALTLSYSGTILKRSQLVAMQQYFAACCAPDARTVYFYDAADNGAEVLITSFKPKRVRVASNPRGEDDTNRLYKWTYSIQMLVITVRQGDWLGQAP